VTENRVQEVGLRLFGLGLDEIGSLRALHGDAAKMEVIGRQQDVLMFELCSSSDCEVAIEVIEQTHMGTGKDILFSLLTPGPSDEIHIPPCVMQLVWDHDIELTVSWTTTAETERWVSGEPLRGSRAWFSLPCAPFKNAPSGDCSSKPGAREYRPISELPTVGDSPGGPLSLKWTTDSVSILERIDRRAVELIRRTRVPLRLCFELVPRADHC
jgi:hypothetical protein